ncbi:MAG: LD-carboxypeptidase [bacterium]|nr:LD-carboxypeptidase [bacterium]
MIYPKPLKTGEIIKLIAPSNGLKESKLKDLESVISIFKTKGYKVIEDKNIRHSQNGVSASIASRVSELNVSLADDSRVLIAVSGGDFINQIMDKIDYKKYLKNVKWIQGHSDITLLLYYLTTNYDIATIYNFNVRGYLSDENAVNYAFKALNNDLFLQKNITKWESINEFKTIKGRIIGGCLESLKDIIGTKYDSFKKFEKKYATDGIVWYFDVSQFSNEEISRTIWQLKKKGYFKNCTGIIFGRLYEEKTFTGRNLRETLLAELSDLNIPIIINCDLGHVPPAITIINGSLIEVSKNNEDYVIKDNLI